MIVEVVSGLQPRVVRGVDRVLISADDGTPLAVAAVSGGGVLVSHAGEPGFSSKLAALGIDRTVVVEKFRPTPASALLLPE